MTRHRESRRWTRLATCVAVGDGVLLIVGIPAALIGQAITPDVQPSAIELPSDYPVDVVRRGGPIGPVPAALPTIVPTDAPVWEPSRGRVIVDGQPLPAPPAPVVVAAPESASDPAAPPLEAAEPASPPDVVVVPPLIGVPDIPPPTDQSPPATIPDPIVPVVPTSEPPPTADPQPAAVPASDPTTSEPTP